MPPYVKERSFSTAPEGIDFSSREMYNDKKDAGMAELADAQDLGSCGNTVQVQVLLPAPNGTNPNLVPIGEGFGFVLFYSYPNFNRKIDKFR